ncbi:MAG: 2-oxoacid:acceptor oxidoreductase family protein [Spirochaetales bacterium]|nr:2-oxoacid:acceptor oxidoreductase family protein [Spirochaetales bacterium]
MALNEEVIFAGFGGQGVLSMGKMLSYAGMMKGKNVSWLPSYGPEMRGGTANCSVIVSDDLIGSPVVTEADTLVVMNRPSLDKFEKSVKPGGIIIVNSSLIDQKVKRDDVTVYYFPVNEIATECGSAKAANMVMLGAYVKLKGFISEADLLGAFLKVFGEGKKNLLPLNEKAVAAGAELVK